MTRTIITITCVAALALAGCGENKDRTPKDRTPRESPVAALTTEASVCPKYIWQHLTESGRGWTYNEYPSSNTRRHALALRATSDLVNDELRTPYFFYDKDRIFRVYWYNQKSSYSNGEVKLKQLKYQFQWYEFDYEGKSTGETGGGDGLDTVDPNYWLNKEGYP